MNSGNVILFDGVCNLCNNSVRYFHKRRKRDVKYYSLQSEIGQQLLSDLDIESENSMVVISSGKAYRQSRAALETFRWMKFPYPILRVFIIVPAFIRNAVYNYVAKNRYKWYGKMDEVCEINSDL